LPAEIGRTEESAGSDGLRGATVRSYLTSFTGEALWDELLRWPPDVFAITNLLLDATESYRFAIAPPAGDRWPPGPEWNARIRAAGRSWQGAAVHDGRRLPGEVRRSWDVLMRNFDVPVRALREGADGDLWRALLGLHAMADEACAGLAAPGLPSRDSKFEEQAWTLLARQRSLATIGPGRIRVTPKTHFASRGISIRSFSRYLALNYESVEVEWRRIEVELRSTRAWFERRGYSLLLLPWPLRVGSRAFRPVDGPLDNLDQSTFGFFEYDPGVAVDLDLLEQVVRAAGRLGKHIDGVVLPESALHERDLEAVERILTEAGINFLVTGLREDSLTGRFVRNTVHLGIFTGSRWERFRQAKHHRWCLDAAQIRQYGLSRVLARSKIWWEAIDVPARTVQIIDLGGGMTLAPLVCEDLARLDETADLLRRIGPSLVIAVLLDGPQLTSRWACRYASVLADEPGSAVLTLTALGMASRSRPPGARPSRVVAMWSDATTGRHELTLDPGARGVLVSATVSRKTVWTADGRRHDGNTPLIELTGVRQVRVPAAVAGGK
jgi:hypothetical protein